MPDEFPIIEITGLGGEKVEPMGTKRKFWVTLNGNRWLFKYNRPQHGEDWSEKIAAEIAGRLDVSHAVVELAAYKGELGVVSRNFVEDIMSGGRLIHGNELLNDYYGGKYPLGMSYKVSQHCISAVRAILEKDSIVEDSSQDTSNCIKTLWHLFAGYLMLDALIGNTDRHHENWGLMTRCTASGDQTILAPSFDHASSLGRELDDADRGDMLSAGGNRSISRYVGKCRSKLYASASAAKPLSPLQAFQVATTEAPAVCEHWLGRLRSVDPPQFADIIDRIPGSRMSADAKRFARELLVYNRLRLLEMD